MLTGFGVTVDQLERVRRFGQIDRELETRLTALNSAMREAPFNRGGPPPGPRIRPPFPEGPPPDGVPEHGMPPGEARHFGPLRPPPPEYRERPSDIPLSNDTASLFGGGTYYAFWYRDGTLLKRSQGGPGQIPEPRLAERDTLTHWRTREGFRETFHCSGLGDCALAGRDIRPDVESMRNFTFLLLGAGGGVLAAGLGVGWRVTTRAIRPIEQISAAATRISQGNLSERVPSANGGDELTRLAGVLNSTFARLEAAFARQRQFTADAAHELRTPLTVLITEAQSTLARERSAAEYRETVEACLDAAQQMRRLTASLLELARFDAGEEAVARRKVDLAEAGRRCVERVRLLAEERGVRIHCNLGSACTFSTAELAGQVVTNLLTNAIDYNMPGGEIELATYVEDDEAVLSVSDTGVGIAAEDLPHIFDRFYRADKSRSRTQGHTGLGLAICKAIVDAESGRIEVSSVPGQGTCFIVRFRRLNPAEG